MQQKVRRSQRAQSERHCRGECFETPFDSAKSVYAYALLYVTSIKLVCL